MNLYPIGAVTNATSTGTYGRMFEPNGGAYRAPVHTTLVSKSENNVMVTRIKAAVYHSFTYKYEKIWTREYRPLERFSKLVNGRATSFSIVDFSNMQPCIMSNYTATTKLVVTGGTRKELDISDYTTTASEGGNWCFVWKPSASRFRLGKVSALQSYVATPARVAYIAFPTSGSLGNLTATETSTGTSICPVYTVYLSEDTMNPSTGEFVPTDDDYQGFMYSISVGFTQKGVR